MNSRIIPVNNINIHFLENISNNDNSKKTIILAHGLSANAQSFNSIVDKLSEYHMISVDLRGRGLSDKPKTGYTMADHANDIIALMDRLGIKKSALGGHSFGGKLSIFLAAKYPERFSKIILIDAAVRFNEKLKEMLTPTLMRLEQTWDSFDDYLDQIKKAPYFHGYWTDEYLPLFRADVRETEEGKIETRSRMANIVSAIEGTIDPDIDWIDLISKIKHPTILLNAPDEYFGGEAVLPKELAMETVNAIPDCKYQEITGNHTTMLFGKGAEEIADSINSFMKS